MAKSPLFGRRIHISGSISSSDEIASAADVDATRDLIRALVQRLIKAGATFVIPVDAEKVREVDQRPICFDWLVWRAIRDNIALRPNGAPNPIAIAVQHHKSEDQIPPEKYDLWDGMRGTDLVEIENASHWNMNGKRMELQAKWGDILIALGGSEGVTFLANLYHDAGKPVVPLNAALTQAGEGARKLFAVGLTSHKANQLFRAQSKSAHQWINQINFSKRHSVDERVATLIELLEDLEPPKAFAVRLLNPAHPEFAEVDNFFSSIVQPIVEGVMGYQLTVIDGQQEFEHARIDEEIFAKLHRSSLVIADITGTRPNCFIELGYALGRSLPTIVTSREGSERPFDISTFGGLSWTTDGTVKSRQQAFREHYKAIRNRPPLVPMETLIS
jgi:hypothetical protein